MSDNNNSVDFYNQIFDSMPFRYIINEESEPLFVARDVSSILGYSSASDAVRTLDDDEKLIRKLYVSGQNRDVNLITESGLYSLILRSIKPEAKVFKKWITSVVIPSIRKTGSYSIQTKLNSFEIEDPIKRAERWIEEYKEKQLLESHIEEMKPKAKAAELLLMSNDAVAVAIFAKSLGEGQNTMFKWLRENGYLIDGGSKNNTPYQKYITAGYFTVKETLKTVNDQVRVYAQTFVTPKGQVYLTARYKK